MDLIWDTEIPKGMKLPRNLLLIFWHLLFVVYFDQRLGAEHPKTLVEIFIFSIFCAKKPEKMLKKYQIWCKI